MSVTSQEAHNSPDTPLTTVHDLTVQARYRRALLRDLRGLLELRGRAEAVEDLTEWYPDEMGEAR